MCKRTKLTRIARRGMVLIIALVFIAVFSSLGLAIGTMSSRSTRVAVNQHQANRALESAMSGMEIVRYWMDKVSMPGTTAPNMRFSTMKANLANYTGTGLGSAVTLCASEEQAYSAELTSINNDVFRIDVTGTAGQLSRTISVDYSFGVREDTVFDFGVATKGPLQLSGNIQLDGTNIAVEADVYIESENNNNVLSIIGNSQIAGDVSVTNPNGVVTLQGGQAGIGGETGQAAIDNHVEVGVPATDFPHPDTTHFEQYVTGDTIDSSTDIGSITTYNNVRVAANTNPHFSSNVTINGIMFIETPNVVCFSGNCNINGLIVGNGDVNDNSGANQLIFLGNVLNASVSALPNESQYDGLRNETGTFLMAPGFSAGFGGNFGTLGGAIAANGVNFFGNAGGTISGSVINYSPAPMTLSGNSDLFFNRSGITTVPAGFKPEIVLHYDPASYDEIVL